MNVRMCRDVCMFVCSCACKYVCMYGFVFARRYVYVHVCVSKHIYLFCFGVVVALHNLTFI
jgi:hypothetical protein